MTFKIIQVNYFILNPKLINITVSWPISEVAEKQKGAKHCAI